MGHRLRAALLAVFTVLLSAATASSQDVFRIGVTGPFTGAFALVGKSILTGTQAAADDWNAQAGVSGRKIELVKLDDESSTARAVAIPKQFADAGVRFVVGPGTGSALIAAARGYAQAGVLNVISSSTIALPNRSELRTLLRLCGTDSDRAGVLAAYLASQFRVTQVGIVHDATTFGSALADQYRAALNNAGVKDVVVQAASKPEDVVGAIAGMAAKGSGAAIVTGSFSGQVALEDVRQKLPNLPVFVDSNNLTMSALRGLSTEQARGIFVVK